MALFRSTKVLLIWLGAAAAIVICWTYLPHDAFYSGDSGVKLIQVENLISKGYAGVSLDYNGRDIDPNSEVSPFQLKPNCYIKNGKNYSVFPVLFPFLSSFPYSVAGYAGLYLIPLLSALGILLLVQDLCGRLLPPSYSIACMLIALFATPVFFYSLTFWEHVPAVFLVLLSIALFLKDARAPVAAGIVCGTAVWFRSEIILFYVILFVCGVAILERRRDISLFTASALVPTFALIVFNRLVYGEWFGHMVRNLAAADQGGAGAVLSRRADDLWRSLVGLNMPQTIHQDRAGWGNSLALVKSNVPLEAVCFAALLLLAVYGIARGVRRARSRSGGSGRGGRAAGGGRAVEAASSGRAGRTAEAAFLVVVPSVLCISVGIYLVSCLFDRSPLTTVLRSGGVFSFSPFLAVALLLPVAKEARPEQARTVRWLLVSSVSFAVIASVLAPNDGGIRYGARYLLPAMPLLAIVAFVALHGLRGHRYVRALRIVFAAMVACSLLVEARGYQVLYHKKAINRRLTRVLLANPAERIDMQTWWMIFNTAPVTLSKKVHILRDARYLGAVIDRSRRVGDRYLAVVLTKRDTVTEKDTLGKFLSSKQVAIVEQQDLVSPFTTYFNFSVLTLRL